MAGQPFRLIEFPLALFGWMQRYGDNQIPLLFAQGGQGRTQEKVAKKRLKPERPLVLVAMNDIEDDALRCDGGAGGGELEFHAATVGALEGGGVCTFKRKAAMRAEGWLDETYLLPATGAHITLGGGGAVLGAKLAD